jgi:uncharacterized delta-60 repeat protein
VTQIFNVEFSNLNQIESMKTNTIINRVAMSLARLSRPLVILSAGLSILIPTLVHGQAGLPLWTNRYNGPANGDDEAYAVATDPAGRVYVTGYSTGISSGADYMTIGYSSTGAPMWTNWYNGPGNNSDYALAVAVNVNSNVVVTGYSVGGGYATIAYSDSGVPIWTNQYRGLTGGGYAVAMAVDRGGNVVVAGYTTGVGGNYDYATVAYSSAGAPLWTNYYNGSGSFHDTAYAVAVDASGNVFVTGGSWGGSSDYDYATVGYSSAGVPLWTNRYNGPGNSSDYAVAVATDTNGNVIVTGYSAGGGSGYDYATIAYSSAGVPLWTNRYNGPANGGDYAEALAVDAGGNVVVTGYSTGSGSGDDCATIEYSSGGVPLWTNRYNGPASSSDLAVAVAVDTNGNVFVTGRSAGIGTGSDYATIAYSSAGLPLWTNRYNGTGNSSDFPQDVTVDVSGNVLVTGYSPGSGSGYDFATLKYAAVPAPPSVPSHLQNPRFEAGQFACDLDGETGRKLLLQASTDFKTWVTLQAYQLTNSPLGFVDPDSHLYPQRFYRLRAAEGVALMEQPAWTAGHFKLSLVGELGRVVVVQASTNLADWTPIATNTLGSAPLLFSDPDSALFPQRFYRLRKP